MKILILAATIAIGASWAIGEAALHLAQSYADLFAKVIPH